MFDMSSLITSSSNNWKCSDQRPPLVSSTALLLFSVCLLMRIHILLLQCQPVAPNQFSLGGGAKDGWAEENFRNFSYKSARFDAFWRRLGEETLVSVFFI